MNLALDVYSDLSEKLNYNLPDFPLYVRRGTLVQFDQYSAACHWHRDLEFIYMLDGAMDYFVNGQTVHIEKGDGIFINSKRLHYGFSTEKNDCSYIVVAVHPALLGNNTYIGKSYLEEKFGSSTNDFVMLTRKDSWEQGALSSLNQIYDEMYSSTRNPLRLLAQVMSLCADVGDHIQQVPEHLTDDQSWMIVRKMTGFVHQNYDSKISLKEIASAGAVCRSKCCELFSMYLGQTPNTYLMQFRIRKSSEMLRDTNRSICEIAISCGFQSASYFSYVFRKITNKAPQDYRRKIKATSK